MKTKVTAKGAAMRTRPKPKDKERLRRRELLKKTIELVKKQKMLPPGAPDAVQIIRDLRRE